MNITRLYAFQLLLICFTCSIPASGQLIVVQPDLCPEPAQATEIVVEESPVRLALNADPSCLAHTDKGKTVRVWKYPHHYQRIAAAKEWKIVVEKGNGDRVTYNLPHQSVIGLTLEIPDKNNKWKNYRGSSKNPIALTQPVITFNLRKSSETKTGGLKQEYLVWDVLTVDPLGEDPAVKDKAREYPVPAGATGLRIDEVWVWQGLNPIPKKIRFGSAKGKVTFQPQ